MFLNSTDFYEQISLAIKRTETFLLNYESNRLKFFKKVLEIKNKYDIKLTT